MNKSIGKKCVRKVLPEFFAKDKKCRPSGICDGFDRFCGDYVPASSLNTEIIQDYIRSMAGNGQKNKSDYNPPSDDGGCDGSRGG